ncbi:cell division protein [Candidatus Enterococcus murrayae]|uniref:Cell division protein n=1 Tax=Candidatus Enterococcus murrayae TaxID=2815321 RepID=A0ABS3HEZ6_9ENTE|nr:cell division protein [Enterococcus sp. MJM16]MBO0452030.1 cell division protein [Enterococcus sp. MJM16]
MKKQVKREEVSKILISDDYFLTKKLGLKARQTIIAILGWMGFFLPFIWIGLPFVFPTLAKKLSFRTYREELLTLKFLVLFLIASFLLIAILYVGLTFWNNYRFSHLLQKRKLHDEEKLEKRKALLEEVYAKRFGSREYRHTVKFYSVSEEQNFEKGYVKELYKKNGVPL